MSNKDRLAALRGALPAKSENSGFTSNYYPFFAMDIGEKAVIRFLPDLDDDNPRQFLYEKLTHVLRINGQKKNVPCMKNYGESECPICTASAAAYSAAGKDAKGKSNPSPEGKALWRKKQHLAQVLVVEDPLKYKEDETPALGQVKLVNISWSLFDRITAAFEDDDLDDLPYDYEGGTDFLIKKTKKGEHANYDNSKFKKNSRKLTEEELEAIEGNLVDLKTLLPKKPTLEFLNQMLDAHVNGTIVKNENESSSKSAPAEKAEKAEKAEETNKPDFVAEDDTPADDEVGKDTEEGFSVEAEDILASIRARKTSK